MQTLRRRLSGQPGVSICKCLPPASRYLPQFISPRHPKKYSLLTLPRNYGQTCHAGTRIYVHEDIYDKFCELFTARLKKVKVGDNFDSSTDQGPQNSKIQHDKIKSYLDIGKQEGATVALGGEAHGDADGSNGYWIQPTIFTNVKPSMRIVQEEIFGPVVTMHKFTDEKEVIRQANDTTYGLAAGIHTKDYERAVRVTNKLKAGDVVGEYVQLRALEFAVWVCICLFLTTDSCLESWCPPRAFFRSFDAMLAIYEIPC